MSDIAVATAVAATVSGAPSTLHALVTGRGILDSSRAAGVLLPGRRDRPDLAAGLAVHVGLSVFWGVLLGRLLPHRHTVLWGAAAGAGIAAVSLPTVGRRHPAIAELPQVPQWLDNVAFGATVGWLLSRCNAAPS